MGNFLSDEEHANTAWRCLVEIANKTEYPSESQRAAKTLALAILRSDISYDDFDGVEDIDTAASVKKSVQKQETEIKSLLKRGSIISQIINKPNPKCKIFLGENDRNNLEVLASEIAIDHQAMPVALGFLYKTLIDKNGSGKERIAALDRIALLNDALKDHLKDKPEEALIIILSAHGLRKDYYDDIARLDMFQGEQYAVVLRAGLNSEYFKQASLECLVHCALYTQDASPLRQHLFGAITCGEITKSAVIEEIIKSHGDQWIKCFNDDLEKFKNSIAESVLIASLAEERQAQGFSDRMATLFHPSEVKIIESAVNVVKQFGFAAERPVTVAQLESISVASLDTWTREMFSLPEVGDRGIDTQSLSTATKQKLWCVYHMIKQQMKIGISERTKIIRGELLLQLLCDVVTNPTEATHVQYSSIWEGRNVWAENIPTAQLSDACREARRIEQIKAIMGKHYIGPDSIKNLLDVTDIGEVPPIPAKVTPAFLNKPCLLAKDGRTIAQTHRLIFVPNKLDGKDLTIAAFLRTAHSANLYEVKRIIPNPTLCDHWDFAHKALPSGRWILMPERELPNSRGKNYKDQEKELAKFPDYHTAQPMEMVFGRLMNDLKNKLAITNRPYFNIRMWCTDEEGSSRRVDLRTYECDLPIGRPGMESPYGHHGRAVLLDI